MEKQTGMSQVSKAQAMSGIASHNRAKPTYQLVDNRPEAVAQKKLRQVINDSALVQQAAQMQALADEYTARELPLIQQKEAVDAGNSNELVAQRSPKDWRRDPDIANALAHDHGMFSTWKKVKQQIRKYKALTQNPIADRIAILDKLSRLLNTWESKPLPTKGRKHVRATQITAELPRLRALIATERTQIVDDRFVEDHYAKTIQQVPIPAALTAGLNGAGMTIPARAQQLFQNINNFPFRYTGSYLPPNAAYQAHQGDCATLARMFLEVARVHGIPATEGGLGGQHLVMPHAIHGRAALGNTEGDTHWYFNYHSWVDVQGTPYDLLFMVSPLLPVIHKADDRAHRGVNYILFAQGSCIITPWEGRNLNYDIEGSGKVFNDENATTAFIDQHLPN